MSPPPLLPHLASLLHPPFFSLRHVPSASLFALRQPDHPPFPIPNNITTAAGNTYKNIYEATTMSSGLLFVILANIVTASLAIFFYRYVILRHIGFLTSDEVRLLRKYPTVQSHHQYTPTEASVRALPPMRWHGWRDFCFSSEAALSRDAQVYLLFQRACIVTVFVCALASSCLLMPSYWFGGDILRASVSGKPPPHTLLSLFKSDRGVFERFTIHNLPQHSPLVLLQLPVFVLVAMCVVALYSVVHTAGGESHTVEEWLRSAPSGSHVASMLRADDRPRPVSPKNHWTVFARGLPRDISSGDDLSNILNAIYPNEIVWVELVCKGKMSEARLLRALANARHRLEYLRNSPDQCNLKYYGTSLIPAIFSLFAPRPNRAQVISALEAKIESLRSDFESRKTDPVKDFLGCAFITFRSPAAVESVIKDFPISMKRKRYFERTGQHYLSLESPTVSISPGHARAESDIRVTGLKNLYRGTVNLFPPFLRERLLSPTGASPVLPLTLSNHSLESPNHLEDSNAFRESAIAKLRNMKAEPAPKSGDIIWQNIGISFLERTVREIVVQLLVFAFLILFTSPVATLTALRLVFSELAVLKDPQGFFASASNHNNTLLSPLVGTPFNESDGLAFFSNLGSDGGATVEAVSNDVVNILPSFLSSNALLTAAILAYVPVLLLALIFAIVPSLLRLTCSMEGYPTRSALEMSVFRKTSFYYVMNAVVLPSLALNTASEFLEMLYKQSGGGVNVYNALPILKRLFSGDIAYFLCSYLIQLALTGSAFWLIRIPSSVSMIFRRRMALTPLEVAESKCADVFDYPRHYAYNVTVMSMVLLFGFMAPLIWYFALFYFMCKHMVDCYTLRYVHPRTHMDGRLPRLSANFILIWTTVSQLSLAIIYYLQGWLRAGVLTAVLCVLTVTGCLSVSSTVSNRILSVIATFRDRAVDNIMAFAEKSFRTAGTTLHSASSGSGQSLPDSDDSEAMLLQEPVSRRVSLEIDGLRELRTSSFLPDLVTNKCAQPCDGAPGMSDGSVGNSVTTVCANVPAPPPDDTETNDEITLSSDSYMAPRKSSTKGYGACKLDRYWGKLRLAGD